MMTAEQYCFPYLFDLVQFRLLLQPFGLKASIVHDAETKMPEQLQITKEGVSHVLLGIPFGACFMLEQHNLYVWETDTDMIDIQQVSLHELAAEPWMMNVKLDLSIYTAGKNNFNAHLDCACFVTFARKSSINYHQQDLEKFAIMVLMKDAINIIPFHSFNQVTSAMSYTWPITARIDLASKILYGKGMRMHDFNVELDWAL